MGKHATCIYVANSINAFLRRLHVIIDDDAPQAVFHRRFLQSVALDTRSTSRSHKNNVGTELLLFPLASEKDGVVGNPFHAALHKELYAAFLQRLAQTFSYVAVKNGKTLRKIFHNGYLVAESAVYARHLHTYYASTDYHKTAGNGVRCESLCGGGSKEFFGRNDIGFTGSLNR